MSSTGVNVLRWSALAFGLFYGFSHQRTITALQQSEREKRAYEDKQKLIDQAKAEFAKQKRPKAAPREDVVFDEKDPKFDLEKYLLRVAKEQP